MKPVTDAFADIEDCPLCGKANCEEHIPEDASKQRKSGPFLTFSRAADVISIPRPVPIIDGVAWAGCVTVLVSESGIGKTFVALDMTASVSADLPWHGRAVLQGSVAYLSFEGDALGLRLRALRDVHGHRLEHVYVLRASDPVSPRVTREGEERSIGEAMVTDALGALAAELAAAKRPPIVLVIVDTVRASMAGSEDNSEHVSAYLRAVRRLLSCVPGAAVILAHHTGWQDADDTRKKRERGSSAWRGNCDATLYLEAGDLDQASGECPLTLRALKVRDVERPAPVHLIRRRVELCEMDRTGQPVTSCVIDRDRRSKEDRDAAAAATAEACTRTDDLKTLRLVAERPEVATSQDRIRLALGSGREVVYASLARLLQRGWLLPPERQRQPYHLTPTGRQALVEGGIQ